MSNILTNLVGARLGQYGPDREALSTIDVESGRTIPMTWGELAGTVKDAACGLVELGLKPQEMVAVIAHNCARSLITDLASYRNRVIPVSIYATSSPEQVKYIVNDSGAKFIFVGSESHYRIVRSVFDQCPALRGIITLDDSIKPDDDDKITKSFGEFLSLGKNASDTTHAEVEMRTATATPDDIATLIYTSGTTGEPKGAVLTHSCFNAAIDIHRARLDTLSDNDTSVCFLPLSHIFEKAWTYFCLSMGIRVAINENTKEIQKALRIVRPSCMCSVPRFWEKVYSAVQEKLAETKGIKKTLAARALKIGARRNLDYTRLGLRVPALLEKQYRFYDKLVLSGIRKAIGVENGNIFPTAGAPLSKTITEFLHAIGINIVIGYGLSETTATVSCYPTIGYEFGTIGTTLPEIHVKIGENNEILVKGPTVMRGYYGREDENKKAFTEDGWFRTGDAGLFDDNGALILTERLKDLFKTSNGKYIAPQALESRLGEDRYIEQVAVIGDQRKYVTAVIVPAFEALKEYARNKKIKFSTIDDLIENDEIRNFIAERIEKLQKGLAGFEKIKKFTLLPKEFTIESGELTNTLKIRRPIINSIYADQIEAMYC